MSPNMLPLVLTVMSLSAVFAGRSPGDDYVDEFVKKSKTNYSIDVIEDAKLDMEALVTKHGYPFESHTITTEDGYILTMHRIPNRKNSNNQPDPKKPIVLLMHGLLASSTCFVLLGPEKSLAYILADKGYDVWMGNNRGTFYSRRHKSLSPESTAFWKFSWDEMGNYDLPAFVDHIERVTGQSRLHYIGHSQGCTTFLVMNSMRPEYNGRFISFQGLAPVAFFKNNENPIRKIAFLEFLLQPISNLVPGEVLNNREYVIRLTNTLCFRGFKNDLCLSPIVTGVSTTSDQALTPLFIGQLPAGASILQLGHFGQCMQSNVFRRYDNGAWSNRAAYGSRVPPSYNISRVTVPSYFYSAVNDTLANPKDVELLASVLSNVVILKMVDSNAFDHYDFFYGKDVKRLVYDEVLHFMKQAENNLLNDEK